MFDDLNDRLGWSKVQLPRNEVILIKDSLESEGNFLLANFIALFLAGESRVITVGLQHTVAHYYSCCRKLGVNLRTAQRAGRFVFIDAATRMFDQQTIDIPEIRELPTTVPVVFDSNSPEESLKKLFLSIAANVNTTDDIPCCVVIDCLSELGSFCSKELIADFAHYCRTLTASKVK